MGIDQLYESLSAMDQSMHNGWQDAFLKFYNAWF